jgi:hypothetical protein
MLELQQNKNKKKVSHRKQKARREEFPRGTRGARGFSE